MQGEFNEDGGIVDPDEPAPSHQAPLRRYSLAEIDEMRRLVKRSVEDRHPPYTSYNPNERESQIERELRTLLLAGVDVEELRQERKRRDQEERDRREIRNARLEKLASVCSVCGAEASGHWSGYYPFHTQVHFKCGGDCLVLNAPREGEADVIEVRCGPPPPRAETAMDKPPPPPLRENPEPENGWWVMVMTGGLAAIVLAFIAAMLFAAGKGI